MPQTVLYRKCKKKGFTPGHAAEVGVFRPRTSNIYDFIQEGVRTTLVEPDPESVRRIEEHFSGFDNVTLHQTAVYDRHGRIELVQRAASTFVRELQVSPAVINDGCRPNESETFTAEAVTFDEIDDGSIDLLSVDVEGSEWYVLKHMRSRPAVISLETHGALYVNPFLDRIRAWMRGHDYRVWYMTRTDTVFIRNGCMETGFFETMTRIFSTVAVSLRRFRKSLKKRAE